MSFSLLLNKRHRLFNEVTENVNKIITRQIQEKKPRCTSQNEASLCTENGEIYCNTEYGLCVECLESVQCQNADEGRPVCSPAGRCVPCSDAQNPCTNSKDLSLIDKPVCEADSGQCRGCKSSGECKLAETPFCDEDSGKCVPCENDTQCEVGTCVLDEEDEDKGKCIECKDYSKCQDANKPVCSSDGYCVACGLSENVCPTEEKPVCSFGQCLACNGDEGRQCPYLSEQQSCTADGRCVFSCDVGCPADKKPICNTDTNECRKCDKDLTGANDECFQKDPNWKCNDEGKCVENVYRNLDLTKKYGNTTRQIMNECYFNDDCPDEKKICHENTCKACTTDICSEIDPLKPLCKEDNTQCVECLEVGDCNPAFSLCNNNNVCTNTCRAHNQCVHPAKLKCNFIKRECEAGDLLTAFTFRSLAENAILNRMDNTEQGITNAQTSGTSVAQIYGDTR